jgi:hypothetical protein
VKGPRAVDGAARPGSERAARTPRAAALVALLAWAVPSAGHWALGRRGRAALFAGVVASAFAVGAALGGNLYRPVGGQPLSLLAAAGAMGVGLPYFALRVGAGYEGNPTGPGYEIGTVFLLSAGLMNILLVLDAWDIASGRKE